ncbi:MAG: uncharacterized protein JWO12_856 [Frankiales bacterium]|nr:uncharacterized protein [Frankiales bacterium]
MASRKDPVSRARGRKPAPVKKPFPVGFAVGVLALVLFLGGILAYAATNQGIGDKSSLKYAQHQISGLQSSSGLGRTHKDGPLTYPDSTTTPPDGGDHNATPQSCQVYTAAVANEHAVHSLEHGAVWVTYNPSTASAKDVAKLKSLVDGNTYRLLSPYPGLKSPISLQAWGERLLVKSASDSRVKKFLDLFTNGPQTLEVGGTCVGTTATGPVAAAPTAPSATATLAPKATATPKK